MKKVFASGPISEFPMAPTGQKAFTHFVRLEEE
jgi:hypothetical protein